MSWTAEDSNPLVDLMHASHLYAYAHKPHRCLVDGCPGRMLGPPRSELDVWYDGRPPPEYHGQGQAVDWMPPRDPLTRWLHHR